MNTFMHFFSAFHVHRGQNSIFTVPRWHHYLFIKVENRACQPVNQTWVVSDHLPDSPRYLKLERRYSKFICLHRHGKNLDVFIAHRWWRPSSIKSALVIEPYFAVLGLHSFKHFVSSPLKLTYERLHHFQIVGLGEVFLERLNP